MSQTLFLLCNVPHVYHFVSNLRQKFSLLAGSRLIAILLNSLTHINKELAYITFGKYGYKIVTQLDTLWNEAIYEYDQTFIGIEYSWEQKHYSFKLLQVWPLILFSVQSRYRSVESRECFLFDLFEFSSFGTTFRIVQKIHGTKFGLKILFFIVHSSAKAK